MFLELAKFVSLLLSILSLDALLHAAFLGTSSDLGQRLLPSLRMLLLAAAVCLVSGYIFRAWDHKVGRRDARLTASLPMLIFWWTSGAIGLLFGLSWFLQYYYLPLREGMWRGMAAFSS